MSEADVNRIVAEIEYGIELAVTTTVVADDSLLLWQRATWRAEPTPLRKELLRLSLGWKGWN